MMRLPDDFDDHSELSPTVVVTIVAVTIFVAAILIAVLMMNRQVKPTSTKTPLPEPEQSVEQVNETTQYPDTEELLTGSTLTPDDFDFWDKYPEEKEETEDVKETTEEHVAMEVVENDPSTDGKHTCIINDAGEEEWVLISPYLPKQEYDLTKLVCQSNLMKYYEDGKLV
ncbi:MAG: hypothetical protein K6G30_09745, partial [Acetatifactor sp.]|nr:hypothetical protein [Acetatifactor sp.]